jgi:hypothetical protein
MVERCKNYMGNGNILRSLQLCSFAVVVVVGGGVGGGGGVVGFVGFPATLSW